jgi:hypothetical protein
MISLLVTEALDQMVMEGVAMEGEMMIKPEKAIA